MSFKKNTVCPGHTVFFIYCYYRSYCEYEIQETGTSPG